MSTEKEKNKIANKLFDSIFEKLHSKNERGIGNIDKWDVLAALIMSAITLAATFGIRWAISYVIISITGQTSLSIASVAGIWTSSNPEERENIIKNIKSILKEWVTPAILKRIKSEVIKVHQEIKEWLKNNFEKSDCG